MGNWTEPMGIVVNGEEAQPGDAVSVHPQPDENSAVAGVGDAGRLLSYGQNAHGQRTATYHSARSRKPEQTSPGALGKLEEGDGTDESRHPDLKIVPLAIGDTKHNGRSLIFHQGNVAGTLDPGKVGGKSLFTLSSAAMGPDRHFLDRGAAVDAIHQHFTPDAIKKELAVSTIADLIRKDGTAHDPASGQFTSGSGAGYSVKKDPKTGQHELHSNTQGKIGNLHALSDDKGNVEHRGVYTAGPKHVVAGPTTGAASMPAGRMATAQKLAAHHESVGGASGGAKAPRWKTGDGSDDPVSEHGFKVGDRVKVSKPYGGKRGTIAEVHADSSGHNSYVTVQHHDGTTVYHSDSNLEPKKGARAPKPRFPNQGKMGTIGDLAKAAAAAPRMGTIGDLR